MAKKPLKLTFGLSQQSHVGFAHAKPYYGSYPCLYCPAPAKYTAHGYQWCDVHLPGPAGIPASQTTLAPEDQFKIQKDPMFNAKEAQGKVDALLAALDAAEITLPPKVALQGTYASAQHVVLVPKGPLDPGPPSREPPALGPVELELDDGAPYKSALREVMMESARLRCSTMELD